MEKKLIIAEKHSVAVSIAEALNAKKKKCVMKTTNM